MPKMILQTISVLGLFFLMAGCASRVVPPSPENRSYSNIKIIPPRTFCVIEENLTPLRVSLNMDNMEAEFAEKLQEYFLGHMRPDIVHIVHDGDYDFSLSITSDFTAVTQGDENGGHRQDCRMNVSLAPANSFQKYASKSFAFSSQKNFKSAMEAKRQYLPLVGEHAAAWMIEQLHGMGQQQINAVDIRIGLRNPLIQIDPYRQEKEALEISNFIQSLPGVISSNLIEFNKSSKVCTFHVVFYSSQQPNRFGGILTEKFQ